MIFRLPCYVACGLVGALVRGPMSDEDSSGGRGARSSWMLLNLVQMVVLLAGGRWGGQRVGQYVFGWGRVDRSGGTRHDTTDVDG